MDDTESLLLAGDDKYVGSFRLKLWHYSYGVGMWQTTALLNGEALAFPSQVSADRFARFVLGLESGYRVVLVRSTDVNMPDYRTEAEWVLWEHSHDPEAVS